MSLIRWRQRKNDDLTQELRSHLEMAENARIAAGLTPEEARIETKREFGNVTLIKEVTREMWGWSSLDRLLQDTAFGIRLLLKNKTFTATAVMILALGVGANTAIFSLIDAVFMRPLGYANADRLVLVSENGNQSPVSSDFVTWKSQNHVFDQMAGLTQHSFNLIGNGDPERVSAYAASANFLPLLGVQPVIGRTFRADDDRPSAPLVALISYPFWQSRFGGDTTIVGREIVLNQDRYTVIGVLPKGFQFGEPYFRVWIPLHLTDSELAKADGPSMTVIAQLKPGITSAQAADEIQALTAGIARSDPARSGLRSEITPLRDAFSGSARRPLLLLGLAVALVLLIACANLAGLLLARAAARSHEMAVRAALGASRFRLVRQLLTESLLLAAAGGTLGIFFAVWSFKFLSGLVPTELVLQVDLRLNARVMLVALAISFIAAILFGLLPALQGTLNLSRGLKQGALQSRSGGSGRSRDLLVISEVALALMLLIGSGLLIQTLYHMHSQYASLQPQTLLTARTSLPDYKYKDQAQRTVFYAQVLEKVSALPGVISAGYTTSVPLEWRGGSSEVSIEGKERGRDVRWTANHRQVTEGYLQTLGVRLQSGRFFNERDVDESPRVAIINQTMARAYWPDGDAQDKRFKLGGVGSKRPWIQVVGIAQDVRQEAMDEPVIPEMYLPQRQSFIYFAPRELVVRAAVPPLSLAAGVREAIRTVDPDQPVANLQTMEDILKENSAGRRSLMVVWSVFATLALLLACLGLFGVLSYLVTQKTPEIGIRMALGAQASDVLRLVLRHGLRLVLCGVAVGWVGAFIVARLMRSLVFGISASDPSTFIIVPMILILVALMACWLPARRATRIDPLNALRCE